MVDLGKLQFQQTAWALLDYLPPIIQTLCQTLEHLIKCALFILNTLLLRFRLHLFLGYTQVCNLCQLQLRSHPLVPRSCLGFSRMAPYLLTIKLYSQIILVWLPQEIRFITAPWWFTNYFNWCRVSQLFLLTDRLHLGLNTILLLRYVSEVIPHCLVQMVLDSWTSEHWLDSRSKHDHPTWRGQDKSYA